jgi:4-aminobutyrate aminotransferase-like enzyme
LSFGGGLVPSAGLVTHEKYNTCQHRSVGHYTHEKNALCAAAALAVIECLEKGLSAKTIEDNILTLRPALVITQQEMDHAIDIIDEAIGEVEEGQKY